jgi:dienelactone hydrolase
MDGVTHALVRRTARSRPAIRLRMPRPPWRRIIAGIAAFSLALTLSAIFSTLAHLHVPAPTGEYAVGRVSALLDDESRAEPATPSQSDHRRLRMVAWYPAIAGTGTAGAYVEDLDAIGDGLVASGSIGSFELAGLGMVTTSSRIGAEVAASGDGHPVVLLSPGNATNVDFYASLAEDLASHGFVVIGIDHPYQSAAVALGDTVAVYAGDPPMADAAEVIGARIEERVADMGFVLDRLAIDGAGIEGLDGQLDLDRLAVIGHSNGGIAAVQICDDPRVHACVNLDGQNLGGPFSTRADPSAPANPFLFLTKETDLHPVLADAFEAGGAGTFRVVVPAAEHDSFTDGPLFRPRLLPAAGMAEHVTTVTRGFTLAFLDHVLADGPRSAFGDVDAQTDVQVFVYPLVRSAK